jgi:hypothetical protein
MCKYYKECPGYRENSVTCNETGGDYYGDGRKCGQYKRIENMNAPQPQSFMKSRFRQPLLDEHGNFTGQWRHWGIIKGKFVEPLITSDNTQKSVKSSQRFTNHLDQKNNEIYHGDIVEFPEIAYSSPMIVKEEQGQYNITPLIKAGYTPIITGNILKQSKKQ